MAAEYNNIFEPFLLDCGIVLKSRICYSNGQQHLVTGPDAAPNEAMIDDVAIFARSGASLMSVGHFGGMGGGGVPRSVAPVDKNKIRAKGGRVVEDCKEEPSGSAAAFNYNDPRTFNIVGQMAEAAHFYDTKILVKLGASFPKGISLNGIDEADEFILFPPPVNDNRFDPVVSAMLSPFGVPDHSSGKITSIHELRAKMATKAQIKESIEDVVDMCMRYKNAGFDGMSIRGDRWGLNASTNIRDDEYGGEIENRGRFQFELFTKIKEACGENFLIEVVMPGASPHGHDGQLPSGYTEQEFIRFMLLVEKVIDIVEIREPTGIGYQCSNYNSELHVHKSLEYAINLRKAGFRKAIAVNGGYNDPEEMERILNEGIVDLISTVRTFRAEPNFMDKLRSHGREVPSPCLRCNRCHGSYEGVCGCSVNPKDALNHRLPLIVSAPTRQKKVAVIGGGLIGMRAACFSAERGHQITIFEKNKQLGGKAAYYASLYPQQWPMKRYLDWLIGELGRRGIQDIRLNCAPEPEALAAEGFDAVIACTGSREAAPPIPGADGNGVWKTEDVYMGVSKVGKKVIIVGGGDVATETAMYLASLGKDITILTRKNVLMNKHRKQIYGPHMGNIIFIPELGYGGIGGCWTKFDNIHPVCGATTKQITPISASYEKDGEEVTVTADTVVVSGGYRPCTDEALKYSKCTSEFYMAGDVRADCDNLMLGNRSGFGVSCML